VRIEWNPQKAAGNIRKHGVSFLEAASVFYDPLSATADDPDHSMEERRLITFGMSSAGRILVVSHVDREDTIRIITARPATRKERNLYEKG
jgi:uncharacterized DUF497 family protein